MKPKPIAKSTGWGARLSLLVLLALALLAPRFAAASVAALAVETFEDPDKRLTIEEVAALPAGAWKPVEGVARFGFSGSRHWLRFKIDPRETPSVARILDIPYAYNDRILFFILKGKQVVQRGETGLSVAHRARESYQVKTGANTFRWVLNDNDDRTYYLAAEGALPLGLPFEVWSGHEYSTFHGIRQLALGIFFGGMLFAVLFNAFLAVSLRSRLYSYYTAFVFCMSLLALSHEGLGTLFLWPNSPWWAEREVHFWGGISLIFYALFVAEFLHTKKNAPWLHRGLFLLVGISTFRVAWAFFIGNNLTIFKIGEAAVVLSSFYMLLLAGVCIARGVRPARIFFVSSFLYNLFFALFLLQLTDVITLGRFFDFAPHLGLYSEVILLSFALADRVRRTNLKLQHSNELLDREIQERKRAELALEAERRETVHAEKMRALGRMAAGIAHEINNPLAIIHGNAVLLKGMADRGDLSGATLSGIAATIEKTTVRISRIVKSMRTLSRDSKQDPFTRASLIGILQDSQALSQERFRASGVELKIRFPSEDSTLLCRSAEVCQVLVNLLANAFDAVEGSRGWTSVEVRDVGGAIEFSVADSGPGIPRELRERIQEPFFTTKEVGRGTGLGLSISRTIVAAHGGSLWLDEQSPHTRFVFTVPKAGS